MSFTTRTFFNTLTRDGVLKPGRALDLGCGIGKDAAFLSERGFVVDAVDADKAAIVSMQKTLNLNPVYSKIEDFIVTPESYDLVSCQFVLHFFPKETAHAIIERMVIGSKKGGVISFNVLGEKDAWKDTSTTWTREEIETFVAKLSVSIHKIFIEEGKGMTKAGVLKFWHIINLVLIKN